MLTRLFISNYALIDRLEVDLGGGLTIITGETGTGKSIILGALALILGERADLSTMRDKTRKTVVEATFDVKGLDIDALLARHDMERMGDELIVRREISAGRSRVFVNDGVVGLTALREVMTHLVDIHSQHSNMLLSQPAFQLAVLDNMAAQPALLSDYQALYKQFRDTGRALAQSVEALERSRAEEDYVRFQLAQLAEAALKDNEDSELEALQQRLAHAAATKEALWEIDSLLNGEQGAALEQLAAAAQRLAAVEPHLVEAQGMTERLRSAIIDVKDIAQSLAALNEQLADDPRELERVEDRLATIFELERKHHVASVNELLALQRRYEEQLAAIDHGEEHIHELEARLKEQKEQLLALAARLTQARREAAARFVDELLPQAQSLGMKNLQFQVHFTAVEPQPTGCDAVEFRFAFNKNQELMPVKDRASGGEISRLMLCVKAIIAHRMNLPTLILDEVDTGVSGEIASRMGALMGDMARRLQVIAITHLPQVAAHAATHLRVFKTDSDEATVTGLQRLAGEEHVREIARMLSGDTVEAVAVDNARALIAAARGRAH